MTSSTNPSRGIALSLLAIGLLAPSWAVAQVSTPWYIGASAGTTQASINTTRILENLTNGGFPNASITEDNRQNAYKVFGGYQFTPNFALEGSFFELGKYGFTANTTPTGTLTGEIRLRGLALDAVLIAPINQKFSLFAKLGANYAEARDHFTATGAVTVSSPNPDTSQLNPKIGVGLKYQMAEALAFRAELERYRIDDAVGSRGDIDHLSIGLVYSWANP